LEWREERQTYPLWERPRIRIERTNDERNRFASQWQAFFSVVDEASRHCQAQDRRIPQQQCTASCKEPSGTDSSGALWGKWKALLQQPLEKWHSIWERCSTGS